VRLLTDRTKWQKWWPTNNTVFHYDSVNFSPEQELLKVVVIRVPYADSALQGLLRMVYYKPDSSSALFQVSLPPADNPVQRVSNFFRGQKIAGEADELLNRLRIYAQEPKNVYSMAIRRERVKDSAFVATRFQSVGYPDAETIYKHVAELKNYIKEQGATEKEVPMLHAETLDGKSYEVMVAIPIDKVLDGKGKIEPKRMVLGNILMGEVKGGAYTVQKAMEELTYYVQDHHRNSPAIPYESLVTNRLQEPDTAKWVTQLYYPVY
jgi:hypothetical protein